MPATLDRKTIQALSIKERGQLLQLVWDSLFTDDNADIPLTKQQMAAIERRMTELANHPDIAVSQEEMIRRLRRLKFRKRR